MQRVLQDHPVNQQRRAEGKPPANAVLLRGCGSRLALQVGRAEGWTGSRSSPELSATKEPLLCCSLSCCRSPNCWHGLRTLHTPS